MEGYHAELDEVRRIGKSGKNSILELENKERERTGVKSLKIGYNRVFGYYIEVTKANLNQIKEEFGYIRKQTLAKCRTLCNAGIERKRRCPSVHAQERSIRLDENCSMHS